MSKFLVTYFSQTGNTKKVAESIFSAINGDKTILPVEKLDDIKLVDFDLIFIGFPIHSHSVPFKVEKVIRALPKEKKIALFSTHGSLSGDFLSREALEYATTLSPHTDLLGTFACRGKVSIKAQEFLSKSPEHKYWAEMSPSASGHPDDNDLEDARTFARKMQTIGSQ